MAQVIKSGSSGFTADVDSNNRLRARTDSYRPEEGYATSGYSFVLHGVCQLAATTTGAFIYFTLTDQTKHFHITRIFIDAQSMTKNLIVYHVKNPTTITGGTDVAPINKNYTATRLILATAKMSDGASKVTYTGGVNLHAYIAKSDTSYFRDLAGSNVLNTNDTFLIGWATEDGTNAVVGERVSFSINGYLEDNE